MKNGRTKLLEFKRCFVPRKSALNGRFTTRRHFSQGSYKKEKERKKKEKKKEKGERKKIRNRYMIKKSPIVFDSSCVAARCAVLVRGCSFCMQRTVVSLATSMYDWALLAVSHQSYVKFAQKYHLFKPGTRS